MAHEAVKALQETPAKPKRLKKRDFTLTNGAANQRSKIASYDVDVPVTFVPGKPVRLMLIVVEEFTTNATAGDAETFNLSNNAIQSPNTTDFVLYENGAQVQPDSVDYAADSFGYTDDGTGNTLHAYYVARDASEVQIEKSSPDSQGNVSSVVYDDVTANLHERDQNKEPPTMDFSHPLDATVPPNWTIDVYADGPVGFAWDDSDTATPQGTEAIAALLSIPVKQGRRRIDGLGRAVRQRIAETG